jgi:hypothetical protein
MQVIQHIELSSSASSITFSDIPQSFTDLYLVLSLRGTYGSGGSANLYLKFNGSTSGYTQRQLTGTGSSVSSSTGAGGGSVMHIAQIENDSYTANTFSNIAIYIPNYTSSNAKSASSDHVMENNATLAYSGIYAGLWSGTDAVTSIIFTPELGDFKQYSSATLYGIANS